MINPKILVADNDNLFRSSVVDYLRREEYPVIEARNPIEAQDVLESGGVDIAVIDIRLMEDTDTTDVSGLKLAVNVAHHIPKIILTNFPSVDTALMALRSNGGKMPPAVDFLDKGDGNGALLAAIERVQLFRDIFIVHGHDELTLLQVKEFLTKLHLNPVVLKDMPNAGQFIMEKLEQSSNCIYVIVLMTPDDVCVLKSEDDQVKYRARQNVILETGYFMGKLGRNKLSVLYNERVELPSDMHGILWIKLDPGGAWKLALLHDLNAAGVLFDPTDFLKG